MMQKTPPPFKKKKYTKDTSRVYSVRLDSDDEAQVASIQEELTQPGLVIDVSDAIRRAIHAYAQDLVSRKRDRRGMAEGSVEISVTPI